MILYGDEAAAAQADQAQPGIFSRIASGIGSFFQTATGALPAGGVTVQTDKGLYFVSPTSATFDFSSDTAPAGPAPAAPGPAVTGANVGQQIGQFLTSPAALLIGGGLLAYNLFKGK